ncbi:MAG: T9SS type A sorting domain-containing protein [Flavobacterium sp.]|nr:MAG: T9SS type A sorting domain-containing protein [Flavobacterium sp.]
MKKIFTLSVLFLAGIAYPQLPALQWSKSFGSSVNDTGSSVAVGSDGAVYITGFFSGTVDFDPGSEVYTMTSEGYANFFVQKLSASGEFVWAKKIKNNSTATFPSCGIDQNDNIYISGPFGATVDFNPAEAINSLTSSGGDDSFILKLDSQGNFVWVKNMTVSSDSSEWIVDIKVMPDGSSYSAGYYYGTVTTGTTELVSNGLYDAFVLKMDASGTISWIKGFGSPQGDAAFGIEADANGNVYATGIFSESMNFIMGSVIATITSAGYNDMFIVKIDTAGNFVWAKGLGGTADDRATSVALDVSGNVYVAGNYKSDSITYGQGGDSATLVNSAGSDSDIFIAKIDSDGNYLWAKSIGADGYDSAESIAVDSFGKVYTTGSFSKTVDFDQSAATANLTATGVLSQTFIYCLDTEGSFVFANQMVGDSYNMGRSLIVDLAGAIYLSGTFRGTANLNAGSGNAVTATSGGIDDYYISKFSNEVLGNPEVQNSGTFIVYPNPSDGHFILQGDAIAGAQITIYNQLGTVVRQYNVDDRSSEQHLSQGVYFVEISANGKREVKKLMIK